MIEHHLEFLHVSLKRGYIGSSVSTLAKLPHCWKSHVVAPISHCGQALLLGGSDCIFLACPGYF